MSLVKPARGLAAIAMLLAVCLLVGSCCRPPVRPVPDIASLVIEPAEDTNPTKTQHTFIVTVFDREGNPVPNVQVHWILARTGDAVGDIVTYDDQDLGGGALPLTRKTDNHYAVSYTNDKTAVVQGGNQWTPEYEMNGPDFEVLPGQTWCTITSPVEGVSHMIAYVPAIKDGSQHKVFAVKYWQKVPRIVLTKECDPAVAMANPDTGMASLNFTITVTNEGEGDCPGDVILTDDLDPRLRIADGTTFPQNLGPMAAGETKTIRFRAETTEPWMNDTVTNRAQASCGEFSAMDDCACEIRSPTANVMCECRPGSQRVKAGETYTVTYTVRNTGDGATRGGVRLDCDVPMGAEVSGSLNLGRLGPGETREVVFRGVAPASDDGGILTFNCRAVSDDGAVLADCGSCAVEVYVEPPQLEISKTCRAMAPFGGRDDYSLIRGEFEMTIVVSNVGAGTAKNVVVTDRLPAGLAYQSSSPNADAGSTYTWSVGDIAAGDSRTIRMIVRGMQPSQVGRPFTNYASARASNHGEVSDSCDVFVATPPSALQYYVLDADDALDSDADLFNGGAPFYYVAHVRNEGNLDLDVQMTIQLDSLVSFRMEDAFFVDRSGDTGFTRTAGTVNWNRVTDRQAGISLLLPGKTTRYIAIPVVASVPADDYADQVVRIRATWQAQVEGSPIGSPRSTEFDENTTIVK